MFGVNALSYWDYVLHRAFSLLVFCVFIYFKAYPFVLLGSNILHKSLLMVALVRANWLPLVQSLKEWLAFGSEVQGIAKQPVFVELN